MISRPYKAYQTRVSRSFNGFFISDWCMYKALHDPKNEGKPQNEIMAIASQCEQKPPKQLVKEGIVPKDSISGRKIMNTTDDFIQNLLGSIRDFVVGLIETIFGKGDTRTE